MANYTNGYIPDSLLVTFKRGRNSTDGDWKHQLSASSYVKHQRLVERAFQNTGRTLDITDGWGAYRPYDIQVLARRIYGYGAATPGQSSHGGFWEGKQTLAIDYGNWGWVYGWDRAAFYADVRAVGFAPGLIHPDRGNNYPDEPWHVVDLDPWAAVTAGGKSVSKPKEIAVKHYDRKDATARKSGRTVNAGDGFWLHTTAGVATSQASNIVGGDGAYAITTHVYAEGTPGDVLEVTLFWDDTKTGGPHSPHYVERMIFDRDGKIRRSVTSQRAVSGGYAVYARLVADADNKGAAKVTVFDADSYLFKVA